MPLADPEARRTSEDDEERASSRSGRREQLDSAVRLTSARANRDADSRDADSRDADSRDADSRDADSRDSRGDAKQRAPVAVPAPERPVHELGDGIVAEPHARPGRASGLWAARRVPAAAHFGAEALSRIAQFGRYEVLGRLGTGGMADVYLARASERSELVAIKVVHADHADDTDLRVMFRGECDVASRLVHHNLCRVHEHGDAAGRPYLAMEFVHGLTLRDVLVRSRERGEQLPMALVLDVFSQLARALAFAHDARSEADEPLGIVHRDVSPDNIMVGFDGVVKLLDFGVAKSAYSGHETESGALKGTFSYMAPEQALGEPVDRRTDLFSLGVCMFEALTSERLFHRSQQYDTLKAILERTPPPLADYRGDVPDGLDALLARMLAKAAERRWRDAGELAEALDRLRAPHTDQSIVAAHMRAHFSSELESGPLLDRSPAAQQALVPAPPAAEPTPAGPPPEPTRESLQRERGQRKRGQREPVDVEPRAHGARSAPVDRTRWLLPLGLVLLAGLLVGYGLVLWHHSTQVPAPPAAPR